jgi:tetratricopeptide (TPR) repeat protein
LNDLGYVLAAQGRMSDAAETLRASLGLFEQTGDAWGQAKVLNNLGAVMDGADTHAESMELFERGLRMHQRIGDRRGVGVSLHNVARCAHFLGDGARARSFAEASLEIARDIGAPVDLSNFLGTLADIELHAGRLEQAFRCYQEALAVANSAEITSLALQHVVDIGRLFVHIGDPAAAVEALSLAASHPAIDRSYRDVATEMLADALRQIPHDRRPRENQVSTDLKAFALSFDAEVARRFRPGAPTMRPEYRPDAQADTQV